MNLSEPFIRRPVMTTLVMLAILIAGLVAYDKLPVSNLPDVNYPVINVQAALPGGSPETMANTVAGPLERQFMTIPGITTVVSNNMLGVSKITLQFEIDKSMDAAAQDVEAAISRAKSRLPPNMPSDPVYAKVNPADMPILYLAMTSNTMTRADLYTYAHTFVGQRLSMVEGVAQVLTYGSPYAVRVQVDPGMLASLGVTLGDVAKTISAGNPSLPTGLLDGPNQAANIITEGQLSRAEDYEPLVVAYRNGAPIRVKDLGMAVDGLKNNRMRIQYVDANKSQPTVVLAVQRQPGGNTVKVADAVKKKLPELMEQLPSSIDLETVFDRSLSIEESIWEVEFTLFIAFILVVVVIFLYLGKISDTVIPSLVMPMSIIGTFIIMRAFDYTIDNLSLLALTLAVGFIIDDAIVVLENIVRRVEMGEDSWTAAIKGSKQISFTILSMTVSLAAVFIPMVFMGGIIGKIFQEFAVTLMAVTLVSGFISLTLTPMLCSRFIVSRGKEDERPGAVLAFSERMNHKLLNFYKPSLKWVIAHKKSTLAVAVLSILMSIHMFKVLPTDFIPDDDIGFVVAYSQAEQGTSSGRMARYQEEIIGAMQHDPNIEAFVSISAHPQYHEGVSFIRLKPQKERQPINDVIKGLYAKLGKIPGVNTFLKNVPLIDLSTGRSRGAYQYTLQGLNRHHLYRSAEKLITAMQADTTFQGVSSDLEIKTPQLTVDIMRDQAATLGVTAEQIENALLLAYSGNRVSRIQSSLDQYDVILELNPAFQSNPRSLSDIYVRSQNTGQLIPLDAVAKWKETVGVSSINHLGQFPAVTLGFNVTPGIPLGTALKRVRAIAKETLAEGVHGTVEGTAKTFETTIRSSGILLLLAIFAIYIILGILYESFIHPITILSTLPPAILGGLLTLYILGMPLSLYAYLGIILLIGIVKKNGIIMIDYALENIREKGETPEQAIYDACIVRFRPIMMTTVAAIAGALPIALGIGGGAAARRPLGMVIVGGLFFSQFITLYVTPVIYLYLERVNHRFSFKAQVVPNSSFSALE